MVNRSLETNITVITVKKKSFGSMQIYLFTRKRKWKGKRRKVKCIWVCKKLCIILRKQLTTADWQMVKRGKGQNPSEKAVN